MQDQKEQKEVSSTILTFCKTEAALTLPSREIEEKVLQIAQQTASELATRDIKADEIELRFRYYVANALQKKWGRSLTTRLEENIKRLGQVQKGSCRQRVSDAIFLDDNRDVRMRLVDGKTEFCEKVKLSAEEKILNGSRLWGFGFRLLASNEQSLQDESRVQASIQEGRLVNKKNRIKDVMSVLLQDWRIKLEFSQVDQCHELEMELVHEAGAVVTKETLRQFLVDASVLLLVLVFAK